MVYIIYLLNSDDIPRLRFGIGRSETVPLIDYVLNNFDKKNVEEINDTIRRSAQALKTFITEGLDKAMNDYNG